LSGPGGYFTRFGHLAGGIADVLSLRGGAATSRVLSGANVAARVIATVEPDFAAGTPLPQVADGILTALSSFQDALKSLPGDFQTRAKNLLLAMYALDQQAANPNAPLSQLVAGVTLPQALQTLISQMAAAGATVQAATVTAGALTASGSPRGNPTAVVSLKNSQGAALQLCFPEVLRLAVTGDAQANPSVLGNEPYTVNGQAAVADALSHLWPGGSGAQASGSLVDGLKDNSAGNLLQNSSFLAFSLANLPDNWVVGSGAAGTQILNGGTANTYLPGGGSLEFVGHATPAGVAQAFGTPPTTAAGLGGTSYALKPNTVYHWTLPYKLSAASPAAGTLEVALTDGAAWPGNVLADDAGTNNVASVNLNPVADTLWHVLKGDFRTPAVLPSTTPVGRLRVQLSVALTPGTNLFLAQPTFTAPAGPRGGALYDGGPYLTMHRGPNRVIAGLNPDTWLLTISNSYSTPGGGLLQQYMDRVFNLKSLNLQLPAAAVPSILDTVIS
jgi:hypothetical protein